MTIEQAVFLYAAVFLILLVPMIWLLIRRRAQRKAEKAKVAGNAERSAEPPARKPINWGALFALRPQAMLTGEMWLKTFIAAFTALCVGVIVVVFVFPLGAGWAASAAFAAVVVIIVLMFSLFD